MHRPGLISRARGGRQTFWPRNLTVAVLLALGAPGAVAQSADNADLSMLVADQLEILSDGALVASGNVEAMQGSARLKAERITYDPENDTLVIDGPIVLKDGDDILVLASAAELSTDLKDGLLRSARIVLDQQMQIGAVEIDRVGGRYSQAYKTVASPCEVCISRPVPLWQIRAERVVHDSEAKQIYFDNAFFEIMGVPVLYLPHMRLPDPTLERARGFLTPSLRVSDDLGTGLKFPYFLPLGIDKDLLLTPYISPNTATLELRYRQAFRKGYLELNGAISADDVEQRGSTSETANPDPDGPRYYLFANGRINLPRDLRLTFDYETTSDADYLDQYDYSNKDRLDSAVTIQRARSDGLFVGEVIRYESLRSDEQDDTFPFRLADLTWRRRMTDPWFGGTLGWAIDGHGHIRQSDEDVVGRDVGRITGEADWRKDWTGPWGLRLGAEAIAAFDHTTVRDDSNYEESISEFTPYGVAEVRWPWVRQGARATQVIEPVVQLVWSPDTDTETPNDQSTQFELDEGNLFSISRFAAQDDRERGLRANIGLGWSRYDPQGWSAHLAFGRIIRQEDLGQFAGISGLEGQQSDWLAAAQLNLPLGVSLTNRALFDDDFEFAQYELRASYEAERFSFDTTYVFMEANVAESRSDLSSEWTIGADWDLNERWSTDLDWRYDADSERAQETTLGIEYRMNCVDLDLSVTRDFSSADQIDPDFSYEFSVTLAGFGNGSSRSRPSRMGCRG